MLLDASSSEPTKGMDAALESLPILPEGRPSKTPTTARLLEMFSGVCWYEFERGEDIVTFPIELTPLQWNLLELLEVDPTTYAA
jgi:hypothetical protein